MNIAGNNSHFKGAFEDPDVWGQDADSMTEPNSTEFSFGNGVNVSITRSNNKSRIFGTGKRNAEFTAPLQFSGTSTINIEGVNNFYWLYGVLGAVVDAGSVGAYTHTYTEADTIPTFAGYRTMSFSTPKTELLQGCAVNQCTLTASVNEVLKASLECPFRYSQIINSETQVSDTQKVFTFAGGTIETPTGTEIANIQNFELTIVNTVEMVYQVGSRFASGFTAKNREYNFKFTAAITDFSLLSNFYNGTTGVEPGTNNEIATMKLTFVNADNSSLVMTFSSVHFNEETLPTNPNEVIKEDITGWCNSLTSAVYTNAVELSPKAATNVA